jgi:DNA polymerase-1
MYQYITNLADLQAYLSSTAVVAFDFETSPDEQYRHEERAALDPHKAHVVGVSFSVAEGSAVYVPMEHYADNNAWRPGIWAFLRDFAANPNIVKVAHNLAFEAAFLYAQGIVLQPPCYDTISSAQLTLKNNTQFRGLGDCGLKTLVPQLFGVEMPSFETVTAGRFFDELDPAAPETINYACADSDYTLRLYHKCNNWFDEWLPGHRVIAEQVESPTAAYCGLMKYNGLLVDRARMEEKQIEAEQRLEQLRHDIADIIGNINIGANASTSAFKAYLYKDLALPALKTTAKMQEAADDETLILLAEYCAENRPELVPLFRLVQEYRRWGKISSTYITGYAKYINPATGRIHADLLPLATETGRFACRNPNLQNCFDDQTEILTQRGFVLFRDLAPEDEVAAWDDGDVYFVRPTDYIARPYCGRMVKLTNQHTDLLVTPDHRCLLQSRKNRKYYVIAADAYSADAKQLHAAQYAFGNKTLSTAEITL